MPTAAKLVAALAFAALAYLTAEIFKPHMPGGTQFGAFAPVSGMIGLFAGWRVMGPSVGRGNVQAINAGARTSFVMFALALLIFSLEGMTVAAFRKLYDGPMDALVGAISIAIDYIQVAFKLDVVLMLFLGGALAGLLAEWTNRRWN